MAARRRPGAVLQRWGLGSARKVVWGSNGTNWALTEYLHCSQRGQAGGGGSGWQLRLGSAVAAPVVGSVVAPAMGVVECIGLDGPAVTEWLRPLASVSALRRLREKAGPRPPLLWRSVLPRARRLRAVKPGPVPAVAAAAVFPARPKKRQRVQPTLIKPAAVVARAGRGGGDGHGRQQKKKKKRIQPVLLKPAAAVVRAGRAGGARGGGQRGAGGPARQLSLGGQPSRQVQDADEQSHPEREEGEEAAADEELGDEDEEDEDEDEEDEEEEENEEGEDGEEDERPPTPPPLVIVAGGGPAASLSGWLAEAVGRPGTSAALAADWGAPDPPPARSPLTEPPAPIANGDTVVTSADSCRPTGTPSVTATEPPALLGAAAVAESASGGLAEEESLFDWGANHSFRGKIRELTEHVQLWAAGATPS